jgi:hypothetical protein
MIYGARLVNARPSCRNEPSVNGGDLHRRWLAQFRQVCKPNVIGDQIPERSLARQPRCSFPAQPDRRIDSPRLQSRAKPGQQGSDEHQGRGPDPCDQVGASYSIQDAAQFA